MALRATLGGTQLAVAADGLRGLRSRSLQLNVIHVRSTNSTGLEQILPSVPD